MGSNLIVEGTDLIDEGITTSSESPLAYFSRGLEGTDLIDEGITTSKGHLPLPLLFSKELT